jgi:hypothetical protein
MGAPLFEWLSGEQAPGSLVGIPTRTRSGDLRNIFSLCRRLLRRAEHLMGGPMAEYWVITGHADGMWHGTSSTTGVSLML